MTRYDILVSIIIPVYRVEHYLDRSVQSVTRQSHTQLEIFLVDDGSPDRCGDMCDALAAADPRIKVIHQENQGQGVARNTALDACSGEYIMFVDADDQIETTMVADLLQAAIIDSADLVICGYTRVSPVHRVHSRFYSEPVVLDNQRLMREYLVGSSISRTVWAKLYRRHLFSTVRFPAIRAREDMYVLHELLGLAHSATFVPGAYYHQTIRPGSTENSGFSLALLTAIEIGDRLVAYTAQNYPSMVMCARYRRAEELAALMQSIRSGFAYRANRALYEKLRDALLSELEGLECPEASTALTRIASAARNGIGFRMKCLLAAAKRLGLNALRGIPASGPRTPRTL